MGRFTAAEYDALPEILTAEQAAAILDTTAAQISRWASAGTIPAVRIGRQWRFSKSRLEEFMRS